MQHYKLIFGYFLICALCYGLKCEVCKKGVYISYHCEDLCTGSDTVFCDKCCKLNGTWHCVVSTRYHKCETSSGNTRLTTTPRAYNSSTSENNKASGTLSTGAAIGLGAVLVVIVIFVILYVLQRRMRLHLQNNTTRTNTLQRPAGNAIVFISGSEGKSVIISSTNLSYAQQSAQNLPPSYVQ